MTDRDTQFVLEQAQRENADQVHQEFNAVTAHRVPNVEKTGPQQLAAKPPSAVVGPSRLAC